MTGPEELLDKAEGLSPELTSAQQLEKPVVQVLEFPVVSRGRMTEVLVMGFFALALVAIAIGAFLSDGAGFGIPILLGASGLVLPCWLMVDRMRACYEVGPDSLTLIKGSKRVSVQLSGVTIKPIGLSNGFGDLESIRFISDTGAIKLPVPDKQIKGDAPRERLLAALADRGAKIELAGFLPPKGGVKEVDLVPCSNSDSALGCAGVSIFLILFGIFGAMGQVVAFGVSSLLLSMIILLPILGAIAFNSHRGGQKKRSLEFSPFGLRVMNKAGMEWEVPHEMLKGIVVETRRLPFRQLEFRLTAQTLYQRKLIISDWTVGRDDTRRFLLAHARARGIPVKVLEGAEEEGSGSLNLRG